MPILDIRRPKPRFQPTANTSSCLQNERLDHRFFSNHIVARIRSSESASGSRASEEQHHRLLSFPGCSHRRGILSGTEHPTFVSDRSQRLASEIRSFRPLRRPSGESSGRAVGHGIFAPPIAKRSAFVAATVVSTFLALALLTTPLWLTAFGLIVLRRNMRSALRGYRKQTGKLARPTG
jgi:hypothetical protein